MRPLILGGSDCIDSSHAQGMEELRKLDIHGPRGKGFWHLFNTVLAFMCWVPDMFIICFIEFSNPRNHKDLIQISEALGPAIIADGTGVGCASRQGYVWCRPISRSMKTEL